MHSAVCEVHDAQSVLHRPLARVHTMGTSIPRPVVQLASIASLYLYRFSLGFSPFMHHVISAVIIVVKVEPKGPDSFGTQDPGNLLSSGWQSRLTFRIQFQK